MKNEYAQEITLLNMLTTLFVAFKLAHIIDWSWWWVLSPVWGALLVVFVGTLVKQAGQR